MQYFCVTTPPLLRQADMGCLTSAQIWVRCRTHEGGSGTKKSAQKLRLGMATAAAIAALPSLTSAYAGSLNRVPVIHRTLTWTTGPFKTGMSVSWDSFGVPFFHLESMNITIKLNGSPSHIDCIKFGS